MVIGPRSAGSVRSTAPGTKRRSGSSVRTSTVTSPRTPWGRPIRPTTTVSGLRGVLKELCSAPVGVDDVDPEATPADAGHHLTQRLGGAPAAADDLAEVVGVHPDLEGLAATVGEQVDRHILRMVDDALDQVLERFFEHVLLGGRLGRGLGGLGSGGLGLSRGSRGSLGGRLGSRSVLGRSLVGGSLLLRRG